MKAKLVYVDLLVRVVVNDDYDDAALDEATAKKVAELAASGEIGENITECKDDTVCPYGSMPNEHTTT
jgi:hypothetical protein